MFSDNSDGEREIREILETGHPKGLKGYQNDTDDQNKQKKKERKYPTQLLQSKNLIQDHLKLHKQNADHVRRVVSQRDIWFSRELVYSLCTHVQKPSKAWLFRYRYLWVNNPWVESYFKGNPRSRPLQRKYSKRFSKKQDNFFERTSISCSWIQDTISRIIVVLLEIYLQQKAHKDLLISGMSRQIIRKVHESFTPLQVPSLTNSLPSRQVSPHKMKRVPS